MAPFELQFVTLSSSDGHHSKLRHRFEAYLESSTGSRPSSCLRVVTSWSISLLERFFVALLLPKFCSMILLMAAELKLPPFRMSLVTIDRNLM